MNILIIRFSALGDLVTLEPAFRAVRYFYPNAKITFVTSNIGKGLYEDTFYFDKFIVHKKLQDTIKQIRLKQYDIVFNFHCNSISHILSLFVSKEKLVNSAANIWQKLLGIKIPVRPVSQTLIQSEIEPQKVKEYFSMKENSTIILPVTETAIVKSDKKVIAISTGSSETWKSKQWGVDKYLELIKLLQTNCDVDIVLVGTKLECDDANYIQTKVPNVINYVDKTNLTQLKNLLYYSDVFIGNDSGPAHIAAAVGTNTITIFGPTSTKHCVKFAPYHGEHICIKPSEKVMCHPCYKGICPTHLECMESISVGMIMENLLRVIKNG